MQDAINLLMLACASLAALAFGVLLAYGVCRVAFAAMRMHVRSVALASNSAEADSSRSPNRQPLQPRHRISPAILQARWFQILDSDAYRSAAGCLAAVDEFMRLARMHDENFPSVSFTFLAVHCPCRPSLNDIDHLIVVVLVQARSLTGFSIAPERMRRLLCSAPLPQTRVTFPQKAIAIDEP